MKQFARSVPLVVVLLIASLGTASAECGWVLWEMTRRASDKQEWRVLNAFSSRPDCEAAGRTRANTRDFYVETDDDFGNRASLFCLPDTIDPRGPKAR